MQFNVENLFDTRHDANKSDYTFLPLAVKTGKEVIDYCETIEVKKWRNQCTNWDWSEKTLAIKLQRLTSVLKEVNEGKGPDILVLEEVENSRILELWRKEK